MPVLTQRHLQVALGILWLVDGGLQFQPFMFTQSFLTQVIEPTAAAHGCVASQGLLNDHGGRLMWANLWLGFAGLSLLPANITSSGISSASTAGAAFALAIWATAEGLGGLTTGQATDPNSGPLLILFAAALYVPAASSCAKPSRKESPTSSRLRC